jgi:hypothetical protein
MNRRATQARNSSGRIRPASTQVDGLQQIFLRWSRGLCQGSGLRDSEVRVGYSVMLGIRVTLQSIIDTDMKRYPASETVNGSLSPLGSQHSSSDNLRG